MKKNPQIGSYQYFNDSQLLNPGNMAYVEHEYEQIIDGHEGGLSRVLEPYLSGGVKHRAICEQLRQGSVRQLGSYSAESIISYYRQYGHLQVDLSLFTDDRQMPPMPDLPDTATGEGFGGRQTMSAELWIEKLQNSYSNDIGFEYMHTDWQEQQWFIEVIESDKFCVSIAELEAAYGDIYRAESLEKFLGIQYVGQKRFSLEGCEALIPCFEQVIKDHVACGYDDVVIGMAHRGRINTLVNILGVPLEQLIAEFEGLNRMGDTSGDVKYHVGHSVDRVYGDKHVHIALAYNPSHLEAINSVVMGNVRARIDSQASVPLAILVHGDASISGQGVVMENLAMSQVDAYHTGGTLHLVVNNQIGFTTIPKDSRSGMYCTDIAKMIQAPVMHVCADNIKAVLRCAKIASAYRTKFKKDIFIDLVGYRKHGHNEADEPSATQPLMYQKIKQHPGAAKIYRDDVVGLGVTEKQLVDIENEVKDRIKKRGTLVLTKEGLESSRLLMWKGLLSEDWRSTYEFSLSAEQLREACQRCVQLPEGFLLQKQVENLMRTRQEMADGNTPLNWGMAELLAYQTLVDLNFSLRIVGQDSIRGTFSHRHMSLYNQDDGQRHQLVRTTESAEVYNYNSILSEYACLGFEYGYAETSPNTLVVFEAQFGDFINGAQIIIDQFISSGYQKWKRCCGLVLLLPHGYEGQGPEHSSARLERFLQLAAEECMQVCVPSTPAQIYQLLLRQMLRPYRRPLVVMTPKSLLRHPQATSSFEDLISHPFQVILEDAQEMHCLTMQ